MATFRILVASDGSPSARGALKTAIRFPWPEPSRARGVVALGPARLRGGRVFRAASVRRLHDQVEPLRRMLATRWSDADVVALHQSPDEAILSEARRFGADGIVLGWRGHGTFRRLLAGSVSRSVVARAASPVLVARSAPRAVRRLVVGFDGSPGARRALSFIAALSRQRGELVVLVNVVEPLSVPAKASRLPPALHESVRAEVAERNRQDAVRAQRKASAAAALLRRAGWAAKPEVRFGAPLETLLKASAERDAGLLVVGARAKRGIARALLGSVAAGALNHSRIPVLIVP